MKKKKQLFLETNETESEFEISISNLLSLKRIFQKIGKSLLIMAILLFLNVGNKYPAMSEITNSVKPTVELDMQYPTLVRQRIFTELVNEVEIYIKKIAPLFRKEVIIIYLRFLPLKQNRKESYA